MEEFFKAFVPWGLGGVLSGGNLFVLFHIISNVIPKIVDNFRADLKDARATYLASVEAYRTEFVALSQRSQDAVDRINVRMFADLENLRSLAVSGNQHRDPR